MNNETKDLTAFSACFVCRRCTSGSYGCDTPAISATSACMFGIFDSHTSLCSGYCGSAAQRSALASVFNGGRKVLYTTALAAVLHVNIAQHAQAQTFTPDVSGSGALATSETVSSGTQNVHDYARTNNITIADAGIQNVYDNASAYNTIISSGGTQNVYNGGVTFDARVRANGIQNVSSGGSAVNATISAAGVQNVSSGGSAYDVSITTNGVQNVLVGGTAVSTIIRSFSIQSVAGGTASGTKIDMFGRQTILSGGSSLYGTVNGDQVLENGGYTHSANVNSGGTQAVLSGALASGSVINFSGTQYIVNTGIARDTVLNGGHQIISAAGISEDAILNSAGLQIVSHGGSAVRTEINALGAQLVETGAFDSQTVINSGGAQSLFGHSENAVINNGGIQIVNTGGEAVSAAISSGGTQNVSSGGSALNAAVYSDGVQNVSSGGLAGGTVVNTGGLLNVKSGGLLSGNTQINGGTLQGQIVSAGASLNFSGGLWSMSGDSVADNINMDGGNIDMRDPSGTTFRTLTTDNFNPAGGAIIDMNAKLDGNGSPSDKLVITTAATGNASLRVTNRGGSGAQTTDNGILLVDQSAVSSGIFDLLGGKIDVAGYEYLLYKGALNGEALLANNYYLRSNLIMTNTMKTMANTPAMMLVMAKTGMNSLEKRLGDLRNFSNAGNTHGVWARTYFKELTVSDLIDTDLTLYGAEGGYDFLIKDTSSNKIYLGIMAGYIRNENIKTAQDNGRYAKGSGGAPNAGIYASWLSADGFFIDFAGRNFWTKLDMTNYDTLGTPINYTPERNIMALSAEFGKTFEKALNKTSFLRFEPKAEISFANASGKTIGTSSGFNLEYDSANYLTGRAAALLGYTIIRNNGLLIEPLVELAYSYEFDGKGNVSYGGATYRTDLSGGGFEGALGLNMQISKNAYLYAQATYETGRVIEGFGGNIGVRFGFGKGGDGSGKSGGSDEKQNAKAGAKTNAANPAAEDTKQRNIKEDAASSADKKQDAPAEVRSAVKPAAAAEEKKAVNYAEPLKTYRNIIEFEYDKSEILDNTKTRIAKAAKEIKASGYSAIVITGHSDNVGTEQNNVRISLLRAMAVEQIFQEEGIDVFKIELKGAGSKEPVATNETEEGRAKNRRTDIAVY